MSAWDREVWARTCWAEARGEGREGIRAVAHVINNRFKSQTWYSARTIAGVCGKRLQFSCWNDSDKNRQQLFDLPDDDPTLILCRSICDNVMTGDEDPTFGCTHYFSASIKPPRWAQDARFVVQIGKHKFYRGVP